MSDPLEVIGELKLLPMRFTKPDSQNKEGDVTGPSPSRNPTNDTRLSPNRPLKLTDPGPINVIFQIYFSLDWRKPRSVIHQQEGLVS